jgi:hypothetical protein
MAATYNKRPGMMRAGRSFDEDASPRESSPPVVHSMRPGRSRGSSFDGDDVPEKTQKVKEAEEKQAKVKLTELLYKECKQETAVHSMRTGRTRGLSFDGDDVPEKPQEVKDGEEKKAKVKLTELLDQEFKQETALHNMRPGRMRGLSFDGDDVPEKPQEVKDAEEKKAKIVLTELLDQESMQERAAVYLKPFPFLRKRYMSAVDKLRPQAKPFLVHTKAARKKEAESGAANKKAKIINIESNDTKNGRTSETGERKSKGSRDSYCDDKHCSIVRLKGETRKEKKDE